MKLRNILIIYFVLLMPVSTYAGILNLNNVMSQPVTFKITALTGHPNGNGSIDFPHFNGEYTLVKGVSRGLGPKITYKSSDPENYQVVTVSMSGPISDSVVLDYTISTRQVVSCKVESQPKNKNIVVTPKGPECSITVYP